MRYIFVSFLMSASTAIASDEKRLVVDGVAFPMLVAGEPWSQVTNFATDGGPRGVGVSYRDSKLKADIYVFDAGAAIWKDKSLEERFSLEVTSIPTIFREMEKRGMYTDVSLGKPDSVKNGKLSFTHIKASYVERAQRKISHYYVSKYRGRLLKIRITAPDPVNEAAFQKALSDAVSPFASSDG